jgi:hypothetical protein
MKFGVEVVRKIFRAKAILLKMKSSKTIIYLGGKEIVTRIFCIYGSKCVKIQYQKPVRNAVKEPQVL